MGQAGVTLDWCVLGPVPCYYNAVQTLPGYRQPQFYRQNQVAKKAAIYPIHAVTGRGECSIACEVVDGRSDLAPDSGLGKPDPALD